MSAGGPRGRTTRRPLAGLHAGTSLLHGSEEGATAGRTPASAKVAAFDQLSCDALGTHVQLQHGVRSSYGAASAMQFHRSLHAEGGSQGATLDAVSRLA